LHHTVVTGIDYRRASLEEQECFSIQDENIPVILHRFHDPPFIEEIVVLSTCNRTEFYCYTADVGRCIEKIEGEFFSSLKNSGTIYFKRCRQAIEYLFKVAAGAESMVFGEREILMQVRAAYGIAVQEKTVGPVFNKLFQTSVAVAKRVATHTDVRKGKHSIVSVAIDVGLEQLGEEHPSIGIIGTGKMGSTAAEIFKKRGHGDLFISSRSEEKARELAHRLDAQVIPLENIEELISLSDIILTCLSVNGPFLGPEHFEHTDGPKIVLDVGMPRNVDEAVGCLDHIRLYNMQDYKQIINENLEARKRELDKIQDMVHEEYLRFLSWYDYRNRKVTTGK
jgi:glutamyl-tRNA reductase